MSWTCGIFAIRYDGRPHQEYVCFLLPIFESKVILPLSSVYIRLDDLQEAHSRALQSLQFLKVPKFFQ